MFCLATENMCVVDDVAVAEVLEDMNKEEPIIIMAQYWPLPFWRYCLSIIQSLCLQMRMNEIEQYINHTEHLDTHWHG